MRTSQLRQDHSYSLECLDLDLFITARLEMLDAENTYSIFPAHNRHTGEAVKHFFAGFGAIGEIRVSRRFIKIQRLDMLGDGADKTFTGRKSGNVNGFLLEAACCIQLKHTLAQ
jgi:hypothetical protein